jgi:hypothetical protein
LVHIVITGHQDIDPVSTFLNQQSITPFGPNTVIIKPQKLNRINQAQWIHACPAQRDFPIQSNNTQLTRLVKQYKTTNKELSIFSNKVQLNYSNYQPTSFLPTQVFALKRQDKRDLTESNKNNLDNSWWFSSAVEGYACVQ